jgi:hypothetical protein
MALPALAQELSPDVLTLARAMNTNRDLLKRLPLYTCLETIERTRPRMRGRMSAGDVVQVDVGVGNGSEMYSWPGDTSFSSLDLPHLVMHGLLSTGMFSGFAHNLFVGDQGIVKLTGKDMMQGHDAFRFTYLIPSLVNRWVINWDGKSGKLQETGEFWVDAQDYHLMRLQVDAQEIPPQMLLTSISLVMDYGIVQSDSDKTLLAMGGTLTAVENSGKVYHNGVAFSHCHVFAAESKMSANDADIAAALTRYKEKEGLLPAGLNLRVALAEPVVAKNARVGDSIGARLELAVRLSPELEIPAGALLKGRIRQFSKVDDPPNTYQVGIAFSELEWGKRSYRFFAELVGMEPLPGIQPELSRSEGTSAGSVAGTLQITRYETTVGYAIPGAAVFFLSDTPSLPKGFRMTWRTTEVGRH